MRTPEETALLIALLFTRSKQKRARVSISTVRHLSNRRAIRSTFLNRVDDCLDDFGLILIELERGGYGLIASSILEGAPAITAKKYLQDYLRGKVDFDAIREEVAQGAGLEDDDEA